MSTPRSASARLGWRWLGWLLLTWLFGCNLPQPTPLPLPPTPTFPAALPIGGGFDAPTPSTPLPPTPTPVPPIAAPPTLPPTAAEPPILYYTQAGDTLPVVAAHFGVRPDEIQSPEPIPQQGLLNPNTLLIIPHRLHNTTANTRLLPDSELIYSPTALDFDPQAFVQRHGGYLATYREYLKSTGTISGAEIVYRVARDNAINPRLLLALLDYQGGWLSQPPEALTEAQKEYPLGHVERDHRGLFRQLAWAVNQLATGYYGWREGWLTEITFTDGVTARLAPDLNAGTVALQYLFAQLYPSTTWLQVMDPEAGFIAHYQRLFGDPWARAFTVEPLYPPDLVQPPLTLPFYPGTPWVFTGGPHGAWEHDGARAALDFAPAATSGCRTAYVWVVASAAGLVVRSDEGVVMLDLDGDGYEQTGWNLLYLHLASEGRVPAGTWVQPGDRLGHPSCEGGVATGAHVHIARKYNGEWIAADGPVPFVLSGWVAHAGPEPYQGYLSKGERKIVASPYGAQTSLIVRDDDE